MAGMGGKLPLANSLAELARREMLARLVGTDEHAGRKSLREWR